MPPHSHRSPWIYCRAHRLYLRRDVCGEQWGGAVRAKCQARSLPCSGRPWGALESHGIACDTCARSWDLGLQTVTPAGGPGASFAQPSLEAA